MKLYPKIAERIPQYQDMAEAIQNNLTPILAVGLSAVHKAHFIESTAASMSFTGKTIAVIAEDEQNAVKIADDINNGIAFSCQRVFFSTNGGTLQRIRIPPVRRFGTAR